MPAPAFLLGIDVGRTGLGLAVLDGTGAVVASSRRAFGNAPGEPIDPLDWWRSARTGIKELLRKAELDPDRIRAVGLSGDSHGFAVVDKAGRSLAPTVLGPDRRAEAAAAEFARLVGPRNLANLTGSSASTQSTAAKLLLLKSAEKRAWHDLGWVLPAKDFIRFRLTGVAATDACDAAATLLWNPKTKAWSKQLAQVLGLDLALLPPVVAGNAMTGRITDAAAKECGLATGTPVVGGAGHAAAVAVAAGVTAAGCALVELGALGAVMVAADEPGRDAGGRLRLSSLAGSGRAALEAVGVAGADGIDWLLEAVLPSEAAQARRNGRDPYEVLAELAAEVPPGADGCLHAPGGRGPAAFTGLRSGIGKGHLVRAAFEGGALAARAAIEAAVAAGAPVDRVIAAGPGAAANLWPQILADALDRAVEVAPAAESAAAGAAILAAPAVGVHKSLEAAVQVMVHRHGPLQPRKSAAAGYGELYERHRRLCAGLSGEVTAAEAVAEAAAP
jgi:xylulokinase